MVGAGQADEALETPGGGVDLPGLIDLYHFVQRRVHHQQAGSDGGMLDLGGLEIVDELLFDGEGLPADFHRGLTFCF